MQVFDIPFTSVSSFVLLMSSLTMVLGVSAAHKGDDRNTYLWVAVTAILGATFVGGQVYEFTAFYNEGMGFTTSLFTSSFYVLTGFHGVHVTVGIIMLTARASPNDKQLGYRSGADIYMAKPINNEELCAAVASLGRRLSPSSLASPLILQSAMLSLQGPTQRVVLGTQDVAMLVAFMRASEQRLENWELIELLNKSDAQDPKAALELQIVRLRKKLQQAGAESPTIQSIRGWGYQLCVALTLVV
jgi:CheY-like chemotaxis protein